MQEWAREFYSSGAWKAIREQAKKRDHYLCVDCLHEGRITPAEEVHHIIALTPYNVTDPSVALNLKNLKSLCKECHAKYSPKRVPRRYKVDSQGRVLFTTDPPGPEEFT